MSEGDGGSPPGRLLDREGNLEDSYIVGVLIGRGAYSMVHKCLFKGKKERACKVYKKAHLATNLVSEHINLLLKINHPNIILVHDVFETDRELQVVVDLATGEEVLERMERSEHYSEREASQAVHTILTALQYLHSQEVAHGAIYPENLLYESEAPNAKLKLSEITMPRLSQSPTSQAIYLAPKFDSSLSATATKCSADIWCLGILIYIMLSGYEPSAEELADQLSECGEGGRGWMDVSASARNLITKLLTTDPSCRATAEEALRHPWVCGSMVATRHMLDTQERLKTFNARRKLRATTHVIIATQRAMNIVKPFRNCQATR